MLCQFSLQYLELMNLNIHTSHSALKFIMDEMNVRIKNTMAILDFYRIIYRSSFIVHRSSIQMGITLIAIVCKFYTSLTSIGNWNRNAKWMRGWERDEYVQIFTFVFAWYFILKTNKLNKQNLTEFHRFHWFCLILFDFTHFS